MLVLLLLLCLGASLAVTDSAGAASAPPTTTTQTCVDSSGTQWSVRVAWAAIYERHRVKRITVNTVEWTTAARTLSTDYSVKTEDGTSPTPTLAGTVAPDYANGGAYYRLDPRDPLSAPGRTRVVVTLRRSGAGNVACTVVHTQPFSSTAAQRILGPSPSGLPWHSGVWAGHQLNATGLATFATWRGRPTDIATSYFDRTSYQAMMDNTWAISAWKGFPGRLNLGLRMLPDNGEGTLSEISAGGRDAVWTRIAQNLVAGGRGNSIIRLSWESNISAWRGAVTTANATEWKAAFRRVVTTMRAVAPGLRFEFGVNCGSGLAGSTDRLAPLAVPYPGDDVVDLVGCDIYDWWSTHASSSSTWSNVLRPASGPGIQDVVDFARAHGRGASFGEWGLSAKIDYNNGGGDNPYFVTAMFDFFSANADVVTFECYFNQPGSANRYAIFSPSENPLASAAYVQRWSAPG